MLSLGTFKGNSLLKGGSYAYLQHPTDRMDWRCTGCVCASCCRNFYSSECALRIKDGKDLKQARKILGWTVNDLSDALRLSPGTGNRTIRRMEAGDAYVTGPVSVATEAFLSGFMPKEDDWDE